ncbi:PEP/pyruvate-binding domain-containing protein [Desulfobulbus sp.]|uniref:PEP/pyruvate-binding domain-containing protein n=1 Tax=Desulfobulbus sp. TaxID=895 RepID=UPI00286F367F|nr:PEP/pyruvate-binding domain-containing protein [Desulfobulbus sp.]
MANRLAQRLAFWRPPSEALPFTVLFKKFQSILERNNLILELMADMGDKLGGEYIFDGHYIAEAAEKLGDQVFKLISDYSILNQHQNADLFVAFERIRYAIQEELAGHHILTGGGPVAELTEIGYEQSELAGAKMATLGEIRRRLELPVPDGFVITTRTFFDFFQRNNLFDRTETAARLWQEQALDDLRQLSEEMQQRILAAAMPRRLSQHILAAFDALAKRQRNRKLKVALRSSAWGEDGSSSFAGQYRSILNLGRDELIDAYLQVVASAYGIEAWRYRLAKGFLENETAMAVGCQAMIQGLVSGVLHTYAPQAAEGAMLVNAVWGLCAPVVQGDASADTILLDRRPPYSPLSLAVADKPRQLVPAEDGGTTWQELPVVLQKTASMNPAQMEELARAAMSIERYYKRPQEIEWTFDRDGRLVILQSRPLRIHVEADAGQGITEATRDAEIVFSGRGFVAQQGIAVGKVFLVENDRDLAAFPHGAILLSRYTSPRYSAVMPIAQGIITDVGSPTGHMATLSREYRVPTVVNAEIATALLKTGDEITLDATQNIVYRGNIGALDRFELIEEEVFEDSYEYRLLGRLLKLISPLHLLDPQGEDFTPAACRSYHDITRYIHEKAVEELIHLSEKQGARSLSAPKRLATELPLGLMVIDGGGGTTCPPESPAIGPEQVVCLPLKELLEGMGGMGMWCTEPVAVDLGSFMSSFTRTFSASMARPEEIGRNLVVVLDHYMNINMRLGYHFTIVDAYIAEKINDNYIYFRFLGGVTEFIRRSRRAAFIARVLAHYDFLVEIHGDLVVGRLKKLSQQRMARRMRMLGGLVGYTRQLDARMHTDRDVDHHVELFLQAMQACLGE